MGFNAYLQKVTGLEAIDIDTKEDFLFAENLYLATGMKRNFRGGYHRKRINVALLPRIKEAAA